MSSGKSFGLNVLSLLCQLISWQGYVNTESRDMKPGGKNAYSSKEIPELFLNHRHTARYIFLSWDGFSQSEKAFHIEHFLSLAKASVTITFTQKKVSLVIIWWIVQLYIYIERVSRERVSIESIEEIEIDR